MTELRVVLDAGVLTELRESVGGDAEFVAELIDDFVADAPIQIETLRRSATLGDAGAARRAAHTLKGNARTFGANELASLCEEAEAAAGASELGAVLQCLDGIEREWARVRAELVVARDDTRQ